MNELTLICHNNKTLVYSEKDDWYIVQNENGVINQQRLNKKENPGYGMACVAKWGMILDCEISFLDKMTKQLYKK